MKKIPKNVPLHTIETKEMHAMGFDIIDLEGKGGKGYDSSQLHRHTFFELFFFTGGKGHHEIDLLHYPVAKNTVHFVSPGQIHKLSLKKTQGYVLCFTEDFISLQANESFVEKFPFYESSSYPVIDLNKAFGNELLALITTLNKEFKQAGDTVEILRSYMAILLLKIKNISANTTSHLKTLAAKNTKVIRFKHLIQNDYMLHRPISEYAIELAVTPNHLNALCKKHDGKSAIQLLQGRLLLESKRLLYATDMTVKEISFYLRFEDVPYFNRFFKKQTGLTPVEYRNHTQKSLKSASS